MKRLGLRLSLALVATAMSMLVAGIAMADQPSWAGNRKEQKEKFQKVNKGVEKGQDGEYREARDRVQSKERHRYFTDEQRTYLQEHYVDRYHKRHCPPGLKKKQNGCMPPGQAKKWAIGRPLPREVIFYDLPQGVLEHLGPPPPRHRFIRVAQDILLITIGTGIVIDAIEDLNWEFNH